MESLFHQADYRSNFETWLKGIDSEISFWNHVFATHGGMWPEDFERRTATVVDFLFKGHKLENDWASVLDVGAGPISVICSKISNDKFIKLTSCDPIAPAYKILLDHYTIRPYCTTNYAVLEFLALFYPENQFDLVTMINSLDLCFNPIQGIAQLLYVVKKGCAIFLNHNRCEAENENYYGFHQWNIDYNHNKNFINRNREKNYNITELFSDFCKIYIDIIQEPKIKSGEYLHIEIIKINDVPLPWMANFPNMAESLAKNPYLNLSPILRNFESESSAMEKLHG